jgi:hypothetical protein
MKLSIYKNGGDNTEQVPYIMALSLDGEVIPPHTSYHVPIYYDDHLHNGHGRRYNVEICGFRLEAEAADDLLNPTRQMLDGLINMARLPTYIFAAGHSMLIYPVYTVADEVFATTPGGPVFRHVELARVRRYLGDYLHTMEELGTLGRAETLHVRGVDANTLGLIRPVFYLKKRVAGENEFWAPVFRSACGRKVYTYAASGLREVPVDGGLEVLDLQAVVADALIDDRRLADPHDLRPDRLFPPRWEALRSHLDLQPYALRYVKGDGMPVELQMYRMGRTYVVAEHRPHEDRYNLFLGRDPDDIRARAAQELSRRVVVGSDGAVELVAQ